MFERIDAAIAAMDERISCGRRQRPRRRRAAPRACTPSSTRSPAWPSARPPRASRSPPAPSRRAPPRCEIAASAQQPAGHGRRAAPSWSRASASPDVPCSGVIDPELQPILDAMLALPGPPPEDVPVDQARAAHVAETEQLAGARPGVAHVSDDELGRRARSASTGRRDARGTIAYLHGGGWVLGTPRLRRRRLPRAGERRRRARGQHRLPARARAPRSRRRCDDALTRRRGRAATGRSPSPATPRAATSPRSSRATCSDELELQLLIYPVTDAGVNTPSYREFAERLRAHRGRACGASGTLYLDGADGLDPTPRRCARRPRRPAARLRAHRRATTSCATRARPTRRRCERAGVPVTLDRVAGTIHGFWRWQTTDRARRRTRRRGVRAALAPDARGWTRRRR